MFDAAVDDAARADAIARYPQEACGVVAGDPPVYVALPNAADDPLEFFLLPPRTLIDHAPVHAVIHSHCHPRHERPPTARDMEAQIEAALPFGIVWTDGQKASAPLWWGDFLLDRPLFDAKGCHIQREFVHGVTDCYALIRVYYWQFHKVKLPEFPRDLYWWNNGGDLYRKGFAAAGFHEVLPAHARPGDGVFMCWGRCSVPFHAGILMGNGLILHHLRNRLSRREPFARWAQRATHYVRHEACQ